MIELPEAVQSKARLAGAEAWVSDLDQLVAELETRWSINVGRVYQSATEAFVAEARTADGRPLVLKILIPFTADVALGEIAVLELAGGEGCVRLIDSDRARRVLLLEQLGPSLGELELSAEAGYEVMCAALERLWRPAAGYGFPTGAEKAAWLSEFIAATWESLGRPCSEQAIDYALGCTQSRGEAHDDERAVLVHGDVHPWNTLRSGNGFKLIDPDGLLAEAEYDLGVLMRDDPLTSPHLGPRDRARWLAARCGRDETAIWEWATAERVSTGLLLTQIDVQPAAREMLATAERVAAMD